MCAACLHSKNYIMRRRNKYLSIFLAAGGMLASCSQADEPGGSTLPADKYPLELKATLGAMQSRSVGKDAWSGDGSEIFGVRIGSDGRVAKYVITDAAGNAGAASGSTPLYWDNTEKATVSAWLPCDAQTDVDISDQSAGYASFDYLAATAAGQSYMAPVSLQFTHKMTKVRCILKPGKGMTDVDIATATVRISGYRSVSFSEGTLTGAAFGWITPTASDCEALIVPQNMIGKEFISITVGNHGYIYTPQTDDAGFLKEGLTHVYSITVNATGIEVTEAVSSAWGDGGEENVPPVNVVETFTAGQLKIGDYVYSDGTFSDGGLRYRLENGIFVISDTQPADGKTCVGIIYHLRDASSPQDGCTYSEFSGAPTGYIVSLDQNFSAFANENPAANDQQEWDNIIGYKYTRHYYDKYKNSYTLYAIEWCMGHTTLPSTGYCDFSSWYLPARAEYVLMRGESNGNTPVLNILQSNLKKASGSQFENSDYMTCLFFGNYGLYVWSYNLLTGAMPGVETNQNRYHRAVCAFHTK